VWRVSDLLVDSQWLTLALEHKYNAWGCDLPAAPGGAASTQGISLPLFSLMEREHSHWMGQVLGLRNLYQQESHVHVGLQMMQIGLQMMQSGLQMMQIGLQTMRLTPPPRC
jgi:hypothetical protein